MQQMSERKSAAAATAQWLEISSLKVEEHEKLSNLILGPRPELAH